nr:acyl-phosphate glycerol 3-phosphate acyltransferase [Desulfobacula sp.]
GFVESAVREFERRKSLILALVPEGTRKNVTSIKTGFWHIAKGADVPIICWFLDNASKRTRWIAGLIPAKALKKTCRKSKRSMRPTDFPSPWATLLHEDDTH